MKKLTVIIPVYQVERYIRQCIESLYRQGLDDEDFEVIFVNDGTKDDSFGVIDDIVSQHHNVYRIDQVNQGLSAARNTGMQHASGFYVLFMDSDDLLVDGSVVPLLNLAMESMPDLIVADFCKCTDEEIAKNRLHDNINEGKVEEKTGTDMILEDLNPSENYVWRTIYKRSFLENNHIKFIHGICYEDMPYTPECYLKAGKCLRVHQNLYIYRVGHESITSTMTTKKAMDMNQGIARIWELCHLEHLSQDVYQRLMDNLFATFSFLLWCVSKNKQVYENKEVIVRDLKQRVPDLWFSHGSKQVFVSLMFKFMPMVYLKLRSR